MRLMIDARRFVAVVSRFENSVVQMLARYARLRPGPRWEFERPDDPRCQ